jgi:DNA-binding protein YbaB
MATPLPNPSSLLSALSNLERTLATFETGRATSTFTAASSDGTVSVVVNGILRVVSITINPSQLSLSATALASKVKAVVNAALTAADTSTATAIKTFATSLGLPALPAFGSAPPDYPDFAFTADSITNQIIASNPCQSPSLFECRIGPVHAVVDSHRRVVTLTFDAPLPGSASYLGARAKEAINCAEDGATERPDITPEGPIGTSRGFQDLVIYAKGLLKLNDRVRVKGQGCNGWGVIGNAGTNETNICVEAETGSILSRPKVIVRDRGKVHGFIRTSSVLEKHNQTQIDGPEEQNATVVLPDLVLNVAFPPSTTGTIELEPGQQRTAGPGYYNKLHPKQNAQVFLSSGKYYFNEVLLEPGSKVWLDAAGGPIVIWVKNGFTYRGAFLATGGGFPRVFVGYLGTSMAVVESQLKGTLAAPNAKISVSTVQSHEGAFHGKDVEVQPDTQICHRPFELRYEDLPGLVPPGGLPPPTVDLGFENISGWSSPQAVLSSVQNPVTQGARSLQIATAPGATDVVSANFSADLAPQGTTRLMIDLWLPANQPNPTSFGSVSAIISVPSRSVNNVNLGTIALTSRPTNQFNQLEFALPTAVRTALDATTNDVSVKIVMSVNAGSGPWYIDNVRFLLPPPPLSSLDAILSFEDLTKWSCAQTALSSSTTTKTHLTKSLRVATAPGWHQIISQAFGSAPLSAPLGKFRIDLRKPANQPNSGWHGQFQLQVDVPSAGISNASSALVELKPLAADTFSLIELALPATVVNVLNGDYSDLRLKLVMNVTANSGPWHLDNIRFV